MNTQNLFSLQGRSALITIPIDNDAVAVLPVFVLVLAAAAVLTWMILTRTLMGRAVYAMGGSLPIAERLGYNLRRVHVFVFAYAGLLAELMAGEFRYRPEGLLDETHLRFFTRRSLLRFLQEEHAGERKVRQCERRRQPV